MLYSATHSRPVNPVLNLQQEKTEDNENRPSRKDLHRDGRSERAYGRSILVLGVRHSTNSKRYHDHRWLNIYCIAPVFESTAHPHSQVLIDRHLIGKVFSHWLSRIISLTSPSETDRSTFVHLLAWSSPLSGILLLAWDENIHNFSYTKWLFKTLPWRTPLHRFLRLYSLYLILLNLKRFTPSFEIRTPAEGTSCSIPIGLFAFLLKRV